MVYIGVQYWETIVKIRLARDCSLQEIVTIEALQSLQPKLFVNYSQSSSVKFYTFMFKMKSTSYTDACKLRAPLLQW